MCALYLYQSETSWRINENPCPLHPVLQNIERWCLENFSRRASSNPFQRRQEKYRRLSIKSGPHCRWLARTASNHLCRGKNFGTRVATTLGLDNAIVFFMGPASQFLATDLLRHSCILFQLYDSRLAELRSSAIESTLSVNQLVDLQWKFGVTAASNDIQLVGNTFLQVG